MNKLVTFLCTFIIKINTFCMFTYQNKINPII
jgi:hypothetical protein